MLYVFIFLFQVWLWNGECAPLNTSAVFTTPIVKTFQIDETGNYEVTAGGACGGGNIGGGNGGQGGLIAGVQVLQAGTKISVVIGEAGKSAQSSCGTAGGGGATIAYIFEGPNTAQSGTLILVGPGGGGGGYRQKPHNPDYNGFNAARSDAGCTMFQDKEFQAATGRDFQNDLKFTLNFTGNTNEYPNSTNVPGCAGGYGGGGQGGYMANIQNYSDVGGGGGGGGGFRGGQTAIGGSFGICTAGGPGQPHCAMTYCDVPKVNPSCNGFFKIHIHKPYQELPLKSRTNIEGLYRSQDAQSDSLILASSVSFLMVNFVIARIWMVWLES